MEDGLRICNLCVGDQAGLAVLASLRGFHRHLQWEGMFDACPAIICGGRLSTQPNPLTARSSELLESVMILKRFYEDTLAQASYLIGCATSGEAIVVDPNRDVTQYIDAARREGLRITAITEMRQALSLRNR